MSVRYEKMMSLTGVETSNKSKEELELLFKKVLVLSWN